MRIVVLDFCLGVIKQNLFSVLEFLFAFPSRQCISRLNENLKQMRSQALYVREVNESY